MVALVGSKEQGHKPLRLDGADMRLRLGNCPRRWFTEPGEEARERSRRCLAGGVVSQPWGGMWGGGKGG